MRKTPPNFSANHPHRRGYLFLEMMATLALLGIFTVLATRVGLDLQRSWQRADRYDRTLRTLDWITPSLAQDVWRAASIRLNGNALILTDAQGQQIHWTADSNGTLRRDAGRQASLWRLVSPGVAATATRLTPALTPTIAFRTDAFAVTLDVGGWPLQTPFAPTGHLQRRFVSQLMVAKTTAGIRSGIGSGGRS
jgi:type II secretory pathway component PulJ